MDKRLTDSEIVKALNQCTCSETNCHGCPYWDASNCYDRLCMDALDLINRLQTDVDNYKQIAENQQTISLDRGFEIKRLKEKVESLQAENERLEGKNAVVLLKPENAQFENLEHFETRQISKEMLPAIVRRTKAEAYKECIEKVKDLRRNYAGYAFDKMLNNLLKELVGEDNDRNTT